MAYTLVDKVGVGLVYPPVYLYLLLLITWLLLTPWVLIRERFGLKLEWLSATKAPSWSLGSSADLPA